MKVIGVLCLLAAAFAATTAADDVLTAGMPYSIMDSVLPMGRNLMQSSSAAPSTAPITQDQIQQKVNQDRQAGEQLQESNEQKQYALQKAGAPASELQNAVNQGRQQQEQAQEQREQQEYQLEQQYRNQQNIAASTPSQGRKMLQTTSASAPSSGPVTQAQIQQTVSQNRQAGEQLQESNEQKQYALEKAGAPASEVQNAVNQGRQQQEQAQEQREQQVYQLEQQYRNQQQQSSAPGPSSQG